MPKTNPRLYIAYGSNLNLIQMSHRCPTADVIDTAVVKDHQLLFRGGNGLSVATIEPTEGAEVPVMVWKLKKADEMALDRYEGYPFFYRKEMMDIELNGKQTEAMVYVMNDGHPIGTPSRSYFNTILEGYGDAEFDPEVLYNALDYSIEHQGEVELLTNKNTPEQQLQDFGQQQSEQQELDEQDFDEQDFDQQGFDQQGFDMKM